MMRNQEQRRSPFDHSDGSRWRRLSLAFALALVVFAGCSKESSPDSSGTAEKAQGGGQATETSAMSGDHKADAEGTAAGSKAGVGEGQVAPRFSLATLSGGTFAFPTGKPTAVWFTANGCRSCIPKAQALDRIKAASGERLAILGVDINPSDGEAVFRAWLQEVGNPRFENALDKDGQLAVSWGVADTSTVVITDAAGTIVYRSAAPADEATFRDALTRAGLT